MTEFEKKLSAGRTMEVSEDEVQAYLERFQREKAGGGAEADSDADAGAVEALPIASEPPPAATVSLEQEAQGFSGPSSPPPLPKKKVPTKLIAIGVLIVAVCAAAGIGVGVLMTPAAPEAATTTAAEGPTEATDRVDVEEAVDTEAEEPQVVPIQLDEVIVTSDEE